MKNLMSKEYEALHNISIPMDDDTFELTEDVLARWDKENEKRYNKYFVIPFHTFINTIKNFPSEVKWFYQRGSRGWSDRSAWSIDTWLVNNLIPMLERLKKEKLGVPSSMYRDEDGMRRNGEADVLAEQRWNNVLNEIIYGLKCAKKLQDMDYDYEDKELTKRLTKSSQLQRSSARSFELIGKHLFNLWD